MIINRYTIDTCTVAVRNKKIKKIFQTQLLPTYTACAAYIKPAIVASSLIGVVVGVGVDMVFVGVGYYGVSVVLQI